MSKKRPQKLDNPEATKDIHPLDGANIFRIEERLLYEYFDGKEMRKADPFVLFRRVMNIRAELAANITTSKMADSKFSAKAHDDLITQIRSIFNVVAWEEGGLTQGETCALLDHFLAFTDGLKKNSVESQTLSETTSLPTPPSSAGESPTKSSMDFGSTGGESKTDELTP